jgi:hypothetical protein
MRPLVTARPSFPVLTQCRDTIDNPRGALASRLGAKQLPTIVHLAIVSRHPPCGFAASDSRLSCGQHSAASEIRVQTARFKKGIDVGTGTRALSPQVQIDADCGSGFCDLGRCSQPQGVYGAKCIPAPRTPEGIRDGKLNTCGAYLRIDRRCRSCTSSAQCEVELGAPRCSPLSPHPGRRCGR